jgi:purine-cytosine permease-like protein
MSEKDSDDHLYDAVPLSERRGGFTMGLLWLTMVTCFPNVLAGFQWFKEGMNIQQALNGVLISCAIIMAYSIPACYLGAKTGLTYTVLSRSVFGSIGARLISINVIWISVGWYALNAIFLADGIRGLFNMNVPQVWFAALMAILMAFNNFFGFSGVANFARFLAAPVLLIWVGVAFFKACGSCPTSVWTESASITSGHALTIVSSFVIGIACWGNEPDYWRFGKKHWACSIVPVLVSLIIGQVIFPVTGWMLARMTGVTDFAAATRLMNTYVFGGWSIVAAAVLAINYVAVNDAGLYASINAAENLKNYPRKFWVGSLMLLAAAATVMLFGYKQNFEAVAALSCIVLPCATVIMVAEEFLVKRICGKSEDLSVVVDYDEVPSLRWAAVAALFIGSIVATINSGFLPGTEQYAWGVPSMHGWIISLIAYLLLRPLELKYSANAICTGKQEVISEPTEELVGASAVNSSAESSR